MELSQPSYDQEAELRVKVNVLKISEQIDARVRGLDDIVELLPQPWKLIS